MKHSETYKLASAMNTEKQYSEYKIIDTITTPVYEGAPVETHPKDWQGSGEPTNYFYGLLAPNLCAGKVVNGELLMYGFDNGDIALYDYDTKQLLEKR